MAISAKRGERTRIRFTEKEFAPYALAIGQTALAWNALSEQLGHLFWALMCSDGSTMERPVGIWNSQTFDRGRREILKSAALASPVNLVRRFPEIKEDIKWLCDRSEKFENERNNAVHSPLLLNKNMIAVLTGLADFVVPDNTLQNQRALNLAGKDLLSEFRWCRDSILVLRDFAAALAQTLTVAHTPWPRRPSLPAPPQKRTRRTAQRLMSRRLSMIQFPPFPT